MQNLWLQDVVGVLGLVSSAVGACVLAVVAARQMRLGDAMARVGVGEALEPRLVVALLAECADIAKKQGLLALETFVSGASQPLLTRGVAMAIEARRPEEIRDALHAEVEASAMMTAGRAARMGILALCVSGVGLASLLGVFVGSSALVFAGPVNMPFTGMLLGLGMFLGVTGAVGGSVLGMRGERAQAGAVLTGLLIAEGVALIRSGQDGWTVERALARLLPAAGEGAAAFARAA